MFEVFTATNSAETCMTYDEALGYVTNTFLYLVKRGKLFCFGIRECIIILIVDTHISL